MVDVHRPDGAGRTAGIMRRQVLRWRSLSPLGVVNIVLSVPEEHIRLSVSHGHKLQQQTALIALLTPPAMDQDLLIKKTGEVIRILFCHPLAQFLFPVGQREQLVHCGPFLCEPVQVHALGWEKPQDRLFPL